MNKLLFLFLLIPFLVNAAPEVTGTTPTEREGGTPLPLDEIAGFNMYCGPQVGNYPYSQFFAGATVPLTRFTITTLPIVGTNYCVFTTLDTDGREGSYSNHVTIENDGKSLPMAIDIAPGQTFILITIKPASPDP